MEEYSKDLNFINLHTLATNYMMDNFKGEEHINRRVLGEDVEDKYRGNHKVISNDFSPYFFVNAFNIIIGTIITWIVAIIVKISLKIAKNNKILKII